MRQRSVAIASDSEPGGGRRETVLGSHTRADQSRSEQIRLSRVDQGSKAERSERQRSAEGRTDAPHSGPLTRRHCA